MRVHLNISTAGEWRRTVDLVLKNVKARHVSGRSTKDALPADLRTT